MNDLNSIISLTAKSPILAYDVTAFLDTLSVYNQGTFRVGDLDLAREIILSNNYVYYGYPFPAPPQQGVFTNVSALATVTGSVSVPPYSYLTGINYWWYFDDLLHEGGIGEFSREFRLRIYDKGAKTDLFYNRFSQSGTMLGNTLGTQYDLGAAGRGLNLIQRYGDNTKYAFNPPGTNLLTAPMVMLPPGLLQVEVTNLDSSDALIQVMFHFAVPLNKTSTNLPKVEGQ